MGKNKYLYTKKCSCSPLKKGLGEFLISGVKQYQKYLSPDHSFWAKDRVPYCKHLPTCSQYMVESIEKKGALVGSLKGIGRILRCMPWNKGGYDPVEK